MRVSREIVIQATSDIVNKDGLNKVSLKVIAEKLGIRTPSLYNHIESLDDLLLEVAHKGMREMNSQMIKAAI
ncbi:TetR/AcrR family transcriptional regulator, partial [Clostridioides difficile]